MVVSRRLTCPCDEHLVSRCDRAIALPSPRRPRVQLANSVSATTLATQPASVLQPQLGRRKAIGQLQSGVKHGARASRHPASIQRHKEAVRLLVGLFAVRAVTKVPFYPWTLDRLSHGTTAKMASRRAPQSGDPAVSATVLTRDGHAPRLVDLAVGRARVSRLTANTSPRLLVVLPLGARWRPLGRMRRVETGHGADKLCARPAAAIARLEARPRNCRFLLVVRCLFAVATVGDTETSRSRVDRDQLPQYVPPQLPVAYEIAVRRWKAVAAPLHRQDIPDVVQLSEVAALPKMAPKRLRLDDPKTTVSYEGARQIARPYRIFDHRPAHHTLGDHRQRPFCRLTAISGIRVAGPPLQADKGLQPEILVVTKTRHVACVGHAIKTRQGNTPP